VSADRLDRRSAEEPITRNELHAKTDVECAWLNRNAVCRRTEEQGTPELREMAAAAHQYKSLITAKNDQLVFAGESTHDNRFPRRT